ncbi:winged helix-turn-helix transcriptional regulator [Amycolatopsis sp. NPDC059090]|uniref:winged helix-turn-helix transcriptional regulator n=1 Tax=unclassified Amycolatopsis TaxID=2618356 RepID=UPI00367294CE
MSLSQPLAFDWSAMPGRPCSVAAALQLLGEKWALLAIREISYGNRRFGEIARNTGAPRDRLSARLRGLEEAGIVERRRYLERPERFEYWLTESGRDLTPVLHSLLRWGDKWLAEDPPVTFVHECGHELDVVTVCRHCGEEAARQDVTLKVNAPGWTRSGPAE